MAKASAAPATIAIVCGLGNPDADYERTRHNAGFATVDVLAARHGVRYWKSEAGAQVASLTWRGADGEQREVLLAKPMSYMNTSGGPLSKLARAHRVAPQQILVVHDEVDLAAGEVRLKLGGGLNAHNGPALHCRQAGQPRLCPRAVWHWPPAWKDAGGGLCPARAQGWLPRRVQHHGGARRRPRGTHPHGGRQVGAFSASGSWLP